MSGLDGINMKIKNAKKIYCVHIWEPCTRSSIYDAYRECGRCSGIWESSATKRRGWIEWPTKEGVYTGKEPKVAIGIVE